MFESEVGLSVSFTRQCWGIGSGGACRAGPAAGFAAGGGGGGTNTPAGTTSADITIVRGVERVRIDSQLVDVVAATSSASISITSSPRQTWRSALRCDARPVRGVLQIAAALVLRVLRIRTQRPRQTRVAVRRGNRRRR